MLKDRILINLLLKEKLRVNILYKSVTHSVYYLFISINEQVQFPFIWRVVRSIIPRILGRK